MAGLGWARLGLAWLALVPMMMFHSYGEKRWEN